MRPYIFTDEGVPVETDMLTAVKWLDTHRKECAVAKSTIGNVKVSTVFLCFDHGFTPGGNPVLWETMVFGGPLNDSQERYVSRNAAVVGHQRWVEAVKAAREG